MGLFDEKSKGYEEEMRMWHELVGQMETEILQAFIRKCDKKAKQAKVELLQSLNMKVNKDNLNIITLSFKNELANMLREVAMG
jgi:hypothetical protein